MSMISAEDLFDSDELRRWAKNVGMDEEDIERLSSVIRKIRET